MENNSDRTKEFDATPSNDMKNGSSSNRNKARDGQDCGKHKASVRVLTVLGFCLRFKQVKSGTFFRDQHEKTCSLFQAEYLGLLVRRK